MEIADEPNDWGVYPSPTSYPKENTVAAVPKETPTFQPGSVGPDRAIALIILVGAANHITLYCTNAYAQKTITEWKQDVLKSITTFGTKDEHHAAVKMDAVIGMYITEIQQPKSDPTKDRFLAVQEKIIEIVEKDLKERQEGDEWKQGEENG